MGYLGLDATGEVKQDNMFQRVFWPSDHAGETDQLGKQGFWVCFGVACLSFVVLLIQGHWILGLLVLGFYGLGGVGVREHNQIAAVLVALAYCLEQTMALFSGRFPGFIGIVAAVLLIANVRGTWIADKWAREGGPDAMPSRKNSNIWEWLEDQMPAVVWPKMKIPFFVLAGVYLFLTLLVAVIRLAGKPTRVQPTNSQTYEVPVKP